VLHINPTKLRWQYDGNGNATLCIKKRNKKEKGEVEEEEEEKKKKKDDTQ
jgi:hypothetical protein